MGHGEDKWVPPACVSSLLEAGQAQVSTVLLMEEIKACEGADRSVLGPWSPSHSLHLPQEGSSLCSLSSWWVSGHVPVP